MLSKNKKSLRAIYIMNSLQESAFSLFGIFVPVYLLVLGFDIKIVFSYFIVTYFFTLFFSFVSVWLAKQVGLVQVFLIRLPFLFIFLGLLAYLQLSQWQLFWLAVFNACQTAFYFTPLHILFAKNSSLGKMGSEMGAYFALPKLAGILGPILGGVVAYFFGFKIVFGLAIAIFIFSVVPMFKIRRVEEKFNFKFSKGAKLFKKYPKIFWAEIADNLGEEVDGIIWPIFVYLLLENTISVGAVGSLVSIGAFAFTFAMGRISDRFKKTKLIKISAIALFFLWSARFLVDNPSFYMASNVVFGFLMMMFLIPFHSYMYTAAKQSFVEEFIVFREIPVNLGRILVFSLAILFAANLKLVFPAAALSYLFFLFL